MRKKPKDLSASVRSMVDDRRHLFALSTLPMPTLFTLTCTQVPRFLQLYLKEAYDFFGGIDSSMYEAQPSV